MALKQISLTHFRNLHPTTLDFHPQFNLICGENASGKTSLLESIHTGCQGQSFRTRYLDQCIQHGQSDFLIFTRLDEYKSGLNRNHDKTRIRINGENIPRLSDLATRNAVRTIHHQTFELITGQPGHRRDYFDWCMFHVEHTFITLRKNYYHALKQRNALLRRKKDLSQIVYWDKHLIESGQQINLKRLTIINQITDIILSELNDLIAELDITVDYQQGWDSELTLDDLYTTKLSGDLKQGYTRYGIHRDDMKVLSGGNPVNETLSRGQLKRVSLVLVLAQLMLVRKHSNKPVMVLIDDIGSELDNISIERVFDLLEKLNMQVFITSINSFNIKPLENKEFKMFHVEHGIIKGC